MNMTKTAMLMAAMTAIFLVVGYAIGGPGGAVLAFAVAVGMNAFAYWNSDRMVLRMYGAQEVDARSAPDLYAMVQRLARQADLPMPRVYVMDNPQPNAFATGRNPQNAAVAATTGLLERLSPEEVEGVMAHELAHIKNHDTLIMTITATLAGAISMVANFGLLFGANSRDNPLGPLGLILMAILAPIAAALVQMAISRAREYEADRVGAEITGNPRGLASALARISGAAQQIDNHAAERNPASAHMFIINPLHTQAVDGLFSTHPATENRIRALMELEQQMGGPRPQTARRRGPWG